MSNAIEQHLGEIPISEMSLSSRASNILEGRGKFTALDLLRSTREELLSISNFGEKSLAEVHAALAAIGVQSVGGKIVVRQINGHGEKHPRRGNDPSPEEIKKMCESLREDWTETENKRSTKSMENGKWTLPVVSASDFFEATQNY
jgi:DNA-directed RNA polymerase subunit alpha